MAGDKPRIILEQSLAGDEHGDRGHGNSSYIVEWTSLGDFIISAQLRVAGDSTHLVVGLHAQLLNPGPDSLPDSLFHDLWQILLIKRV